MGCHECQPQTVLGNARHLSSNSWLNQLSVAQWEVWGSSCLAGGVLPCFSQRQILLQIVSLRAKAHPQGNALLSFVQRCCTSRGFHAVVLPSFAAKQLVFMEQPRRSSRDICRKLTSKFLLFTQKHKHHSPWLHFGSRQEEHFGLGEENDCHWLGESSSWCAFVETVSLHLEFISQLSVGQFGGSSFHINVHPRNHLQTNSNGCWSKSGESWHVTGNSPCRHGPLVIFYNDGPRKDWSLRSDFRGDDRPYPRSVQIQLRGISWRRARRNKRRQRHAVWASSARSHRWGHQTVCQRCTSWYNLNSRPLAVRILHDIDQSMPCVFVGDMYDSHCTAQDACWLYFLSRPLFFFYLSLSLMS